VTASKNSIRNFDAVNSKLPMWNRVVSEVVLLGVVAFVLAACERKTVSTGQGAGETGAFAPLVNGPLAKDGPAGAPDGGNLVSSEGIGGAKALVPGGAEDAGNPAEGLEGAPVATGNYPTHGGPLLPEQAHWLLAEKVLFSPNSIASSNVPVGPDTQLFVGQDLQVKWGETWWAGTVVGMEAEGKVRIHYFGWAASWDEVKTRAELQLDKGARVRALDSTYVRKNW
jgi:hypothetical protein